VSDAIARRAVKADWDGERPLSEAARTVSRRSISGASLATSPITARPFAGPCRRAIDFLNPTAIRHDWVGGMSEGVDFRRYHPELVAGPPDA
jgi:hypothetical protein